MGFKVWMAGAALAGLHFAATAAPAMRAEAPPSADLTYSVQAMQKGFTLDGESVVNWRAGDGKYSLVANTRASLLGQILENRSEGTLDASGLSPTGFYEKRMRKPSFTTTFDREAKTITFSEDKKKSYPIRGGEQDRATVQWQLAAMARANPGRFVPGAEIGFVVAGRNDAELWRFKVGEKQTVATGAGSLQTVHLVKQPGSRPGQDVQVWLAPSLGWYPVKLRVSDKEGEYVEQTLSKLIKK